MKEGRDRQIDRREREKRDKVTNKPRDRQEKGKMNKGRDRGG